MTITMAQDMAWIHHTYVMSIVPGRRHRASEMPSDFCRGMPLRPCPPNLTLHFVLLWLFMWQNKESNVEKEEKYFVFSFLFFLLSGMQLKKRKTQQVAFHKFYTQNVKYKI